MHWLGKQKWFRNWSFVFICFRYAEKDHVGLQKLIQKAASLSVALGQMKIFISKPSGGVINMTVYPFTTVAELKGMIEQRENISSVNQRLKLVPTDRLLALDCWTLHDYQVKEKSTILLRIFHNKQVTWYLGDQIKIWLVENKCSRLSALSFVVKGMLVFGLCPKPFSWYSGLRTDGAIRSGWTSDFPAQGQII